MSKKILVAMSGGVDSSVAALLLKQRGYKVIGVFMNFWSEAEEEINKTSQNKCCSIESARSARIVASRLKINLYELNYKEIFKKKVVDYFIQGHENAQTPNPCVVCNREIKFGKLLNIARNLGAAKVATGHYARALRKGKKYELHRALDKKKDQSYFLWQIPSHSLPVIDFPVGSMRKSEVRKIARKFNLSTYNKKDSQGLCFVGKSNLEFLKKHAQKLLKPGNVVDNEGDIIGRHKGLALYTIGQRAGFEVTNDKWRKNKLDAPPLYVIKLNLGKNHLIVGEDKDVYNQSMTVGELNWLGSSLFHFKGKKTLLAQIRYQHKAKRCTFISLSKDKLSVKFRRTQRAITPGQSCVFYQKDRVLGGGVIEQ